jgi:fatty acid desaturase
MSTAGSKPKLEPDLLRSLHVTEYGVHWARIASFVFLYVLGAAAAVLAAEKWHWIAALPFCLLAGASLHGISLFTHEAVHGTLSRNVVWNGVLGALCAMPVLQNFSAYRVLHLRHHKHLGNEGDPDHYENYTRWTWMVFCMNWLRLLVGYPVYIVAIPMLGLKQGTWKDRGLILLELAALGVLLVAVWSLHLPGAWLWYGWMVPMLFINTMVNIRGMSQHTLLEEADDEVRGTRTILTYPLVRFFMCNENYHLEHHLYPGVPWHHLPKVHAALEPDLRRQGAPYIPSYASFVREFVHGSLKRSPLGWRRTGDGGSSGKSTGTMPL